MENDGDVSPGFYHRGVSPLLSDPQTGDSSLAAVFLLGVALSAVVMAAVTGQKGLPRKKATG